MTGRRLTRHGPLLRPGTVSRLDNRSSNDSRFTQLAAIHYPCRSTQTRKWAKDEQEISRFEQKSAACRPASRGRLLAVPEPVRLSDGCRFVSKDKLSSLYIVDKDKVKLEPIAVNRYQNPRSYIHG
ncbi:hypothetical protein PM082_024227 [Marasmius tenuissimus]|nr:hypothetical protein PM082_024227 [Marasmius tenuissimus]